MSDQEKFMGFKRKLVDENEKKYGREARERYGDEAVDRPNKKVLNMTKEQHEELESISRKLTETLRAAFKTGDPAGELAQKAVDLHRRWLCFYWDEYSREAHADWPRCTWRMRGSGPITTRSSPERPLS